MKRAHALIAVCILVSGCSEPRRGLGSVTAPTPVNVPPLAPGGYTITGTIRDPDSGPLANVTVVASDATRAQRSSVSGATGQYSIGSVSGLISLRVSTDGYLDWLGTRYIAADQVLDISLARIIELVAGTTLRGTVRGEPCDPVRWDARALCQRLFFTSPTAGTLDLALSWSGPSELDLLFDQLYFDPPNKQGRIHARVSVTPGMRHEIRINSYYAPQEYELHTEFDPAS